MSTEGLGAEAWLWARDLMPINRSLTGEGVRETLDYLGQLIPGLVRHHLPTGSQVFDWTIPKEWRVREAYLADASGSRVVDFAKNNLHLVGYSTPVRTTLSLAELDGHLHSLPEQPDAIPYVTSYYAPNWGFCLTHEQRLLLRDDSYEVVIDTELFDGQLDFADWVLPGDTDEEILISTYVCHPSMANNELSGPVVATALCRWLTAQERRRFTYRFVFVPETIGAIAYTSLHLDALKAHVHAGYVVTCVGDDRRYSFLPSRKGNTPADRAGLSALRSVTEDYDCYTFLDRGSDERQYCSPHVDLPVASLMRSKYGEYPEYHTSLDDLTLVTPTGLQGAIDVYARALLLLENNRHWRITTPCEPQLGRRGLYPTLSKVGSAAGLADMRNLLAYADGSEDYLAVCSRIGADPVALLPTLRRLADEGLLTAL
jgi:aminopeptidase-like protein